MSNRNRVEELETQHREYAKKKLEAGLETMQRAIDEGSRAIARMDEDKDFLPIRALERVQHALMWGMANAHSSFSSVHRTTEEDFVNLKLADKDE